MPNNLVLPKAGSKASSRSSSKQSRVHSPPTLSYAPALATLFLGKASRVFASFVSYHYLQDRVALPLYLFFVTFGAAATLLALQRPWNGKRIGQKRARRVLIAGGLLAITLYIWTAGLRSAGPLRTLLVDGAELPLLYVFAVVTRRELPEKRKTRGAICMLIAYCLLIWDASGHAPDVAEIEHSRLGQRAENTIGKIANKTSAEIENIRHLGTDANANGDGNTGHGGPRRRLLTTYQPPVQGSGQLRDAFVEGTALRSEFGVILVLSASVIMQSSRAFNRRLATELGGAKRHFALSTSSAWAWMTPLALLSFMSSSTGAVLSLSVVGGIEPMTMNVGHVVGFAMVGFLWLVLPYYVRAIVSTTVPQRTMLQSGVAVPFILAVVGSFVVGEMGSGGGVSWILVIAFLLECAGVTMMMAGGVRRGLSELPIDGSGTIGSRTDAGEAEETPATPPSTPPPAPSTPEWLYAPPPPPTALQVRLDGELADSRPPSSSTSLATATRIEKKASSRPRSQSKKNPSPIKSVVHLPKSPPRKSEPVSLKEKREKEARLFPKEVLSNLDGTTSAEVRKMNSTERELVLFKRKLRNRESARRSRQKRQAALADLQEQVDDLMQFSSRMVDIGLSLKQENDRLKDRLALALAEIKGLKGRCDSAEPAPDAAMKMKLGG